ncbi:MAG: wax ester/triacylglycerol synthase family O-acyltransferase [Solirubrobacterales bacterium]
MSTTRLSALDSAFLAVETPTAHMHVGWASALDPPAHGRRPSFAELRDHIGSRLRRAPRYRQLLHPVPLGLTAPVWADDPEFEISRHVGESGRERLTDVVADSMSEPLPRDRPLWHMSIAPRLEDGRIGLVGKAHHCMVDGIAAVELASLLLDPEPQPPALGPDEWAPRPAPDPASLLAGGFAEAARAALGVATLPARSATSPGRLASRAGRALRALAGSARPATPVRPLNRPNSPGRHLALLPRPLDDLRRIKSTFGTKLNDVVLAASAGAVRRLFDRRGEAPIALKTMVPVNVRGGDDAAQLGNRISFMFVDLPCDEPDPVRRLQRVHAETSRRKRGGEPEGTSDVVKSIGLVPTPVQEAVSRFVATPRTFNLVVSNIPGPRERMYLRGCELKEVYPVVPLADRHALAIGVTNVGNKLGFGIYADRESLPDADAVARDLEESIDELLAVA